MPNYRQSLSRSLENKVLVIVRRYVNDLAASQEQEGDVRLSVSKLYKYIVADGGVPRQKKANLERMIEKAVEVLQEEGEDDEENEIDSDFEGLNEEGLMEPKVGIFFGIYGGEEGGGRGRKGEGQFANSGHLEYKCREQEDCGYVGYGTHGHTHTYTHTLNSNSNSNFNSRRNYHRHYHHHTRTRTRIAASPETERTSCQRWRT